MSKVAIVEDVKCCDLVKQMSSKYRVSLSYVNCQVFSELVNMDSLQSVKCADQRAKDIVYGFIKHMEQSLALRAIPTEIYDIFLAFYYFGEYFYKAREDCFKISDDKSTITCIKDCSYTNHTIYLEQIIPSLSKEIISWTFRVNKRQLFVFLGIVND